MNISFELLCDKTSSSAGKFYAGVIDDRIAFTISGGLTSGVNGKIVDRSSADEVRRMLVSKKKGNYQVAQVSILPAGVRASITERVSSALGCSPDSISITDAGISVSTSGATISRPRRKSRSFDVWI